MTTTLTDKQQAYIAAAPNSFGGVLQRAFEGNASPRQAIKAKCLTCCNYQRNEISGCSIALCPLWAYRPYVDQAAQNAVDRLGL